MEKITGNEPAYPCETLIEGNVGGVTGLTKREYFAAMALQGLCANPKFYEIASEKLTPDTIGGFYALCAVEQADALIDQLQKPVI